LVEKADLSSVRLLGTVGEPINPEAWHWYYEVVGKSNCPVVDTWWQTETGGIMITSLPGAVGMKPGCAGKPFFGVQPALLDKEGNTLEGENQGLLVMTGSWPGQLRTVYGDHDRFYQTYLSQYPGNYFTGDGAKRDKDDFYWITGRVDDVLNVSGHRLGTAEIESALVLHPSVAEAAVVGYPHEIKGQGVYCYVTLMQGAKQNNKLNNDLKEFVANELGRFAKPDYIQWAPGLPKTRSGKIMRRILRKIAENDVDTLGDTSTLADPSVVDNLIEQRIFQGS
jgi:acetyl-CoA synthetase